MASDKSQKGQRRPLIAANWRVFMVRSASSYASHKKRAAIYGKTLNYSLDELRLLVQEGERCQYCGRTLTSHNFSLDHDEAVSTGGCFTLANLNVCCQQCNQTKGILNSGEFDLLLNLMKEFRPASRSNVLARLRAGARIVAGR